MKSPVLLLLTAALAFGVTSPKEFLGFNVGDDYQVVNYTRLEGYWKKLANESDRIKLVEIGRTAEGRPHWMAIVSAPENIRNLAKYKAIAERLAHAETLDEAHARELARDGKAIVWIDGGLHANETVGSQQLIETVYQLASRTDEETLRLLRDNIVLCAVANPDGQEFVADWYMREPDPLKRSLNGLPRLYNKYVGHDDNRDFYMSNMPETTNINRQLFIEWFPQIVYDHHQTGPAGAVVFIPPFRDPFNYTFDPLIPLGIEMAGTAMHSRLVAEGKGGSAMRSGSTYSTWWNGGLRTIAYFHNAIGILTEIIGNPTPITVPLVPDKQLPQGDWPLPIPPGPWRYRQSIDYDVTNNYAILDYASRYRETLLFNSWRMGMNSIEKGSRDTWTVTPRRIEAIKAAAPKNGRGAGVPADLYTSVLHDPNYRDPRGYILSAGQADFPTAVKFANALIKNGVAVLRADSAFTVNGRQYPAGSLVVKTAQAFRPHVLDMFEPQDHPNDFAYPGGPPNRPYDIAGWTLALQMGVAFDRVLDKFDGPFSPVRGMLDAPSSAVRGPANPAGWLISHRQNDSFVAVNRLLKAGAEVYWLKKDVASMGFGAIWVPASASARSIVETAAKQLGLTVEALAARPAGEAMRLRPVRIGLYDQYGGLMPAGWTRWLLEQFEFPFERVYPQTLDAGDLRAKLDVIVFVDGATRLGEQGGRGRGGFAESAPDNVPAEYRAATGRFTVEKTLPQIRKFLESGGEVIAIGSSTGMAEALGLPVRGALTELASDGRERALPPEKFYIPGSLLRAQVDTANPLAYGMPGTVDVFFDNSPVFRLNPDAAIKHASSVAWFGPDSLHSGWAWGQQYLNGGTAVAEASVGEGKIVLLGPEVAFRGQPHGTFKFLFNALYYGVASTVELK